MSSSNGCLTLVIPLGSPSVLWLRTRHSAMEGVGLHGVRQLDVVAEIVATRVGSHGLHRELPFAGLQPPQVVEQSSRDRSRASRLARSKALAVPHRIRSTVRSLSVPNVEGNEIA